MNGNTSLQLAAEAKLNFGERVVRDGCLSITQFQINELMMELIQIYDDGFRYPDDLRSGAIEVAAEIAKQNSGALALLLDNAATWSKTMHSGDAFPTRNSFEVLSRVCTPGDAVILSFLTSAATNDYGIPAWAAVQALNVVRARLDGERHLSDADLRRAEYRDSGDLPTLNAVRSKAGSPSDVLHAAIPLAAALVLVASVVVAVSANLSEVVHHVSLV